MSIWSRILLFFKVKTKAALDRAEDPRQVMDYAYEQQQELLLKTRRGLIEVATAKAQLEQQSRKLGARVPQLEEQARRALTSGREDLARIALQRKQTALAELEDLEHQLVEVAEEERKLTMVGLQLAARIDEFRAHREVMSARYTAAEAQVRVNEALSGVSGELADLGMALARAEDKTRRMVARASAIESLIEVGSLPQLGDGDPVEGELRKLASGQAVEDELAELKAQLTAGEEPPALESGE
jgi:phage shock protein A